jgi:hypothetical protein
MYRKIRRREAGHARGFGIRSAGETFMKKYSRQEILYLIPEEILEECHQKLQALTKAGTFPDLPEDPYDPHQQLEHGLENVKAFEARAQMYDISAETSQVLGDHYMAQYRHMKHQAATSKLGETPSSIKSFLDYTYYTAKEHLLFAKTYREKARLCRKALKSYEKTNAYAKRCIENGTEKIPKKKVNKYSLYSIDDCFAASGCLDGHELDDINMAVDQMPG